MLYLSSIYSIYVVMSPFHWHCGIQCLTLDSLEDVKDIEYLCLFATTKCCNFIEMVKPNMQLWVV